MAGIGSLAGKRGAIFGFASARSLAWAVAEAWNAAGARLAIGIQNDRFHPALSKLTSGWAIQPLIVNCDVSNDSEIAEAFRQITEFHEGKLDCMLHSMAYATAHAMKSPFIECSREDFRVAHEISAYSLVALAREARPTMKAAGGGSITTLTYIGSQRVVPNYKVMGAAKASLEACTRYLAAELGADHVRVNAVSAGPIDTLAARGIPGFTVSPFRAAVAMQLRHVILASTYGMQSMREASATRAPLGRGITGRDVGATATFLASDGGAGITGQTLVVDCGDSVLL